MNKRIRINGKLYEAVSPRNRVLNESYGKPITKSVAMKYDLVGAEDLPDGSPALYFTTENDSELVIITIAGVDDTFGQIAIMSNDLVYGDPDGIWTYDFDAEDTDSALKKFDKICSAIDSGKSVSQVANQFDMDRID